MRRPPWSRGVDAGLAARRVSRSIHLAMRSWSADGRVGSDSVTVRRRVNCSQPGTPTRWSHMTAPPRSQGSLVTVLGVVVLVLIGALAHSLLGIAHLLGLLVELAAAAVIAFVVFGLARFLSMRVSAPGWLWGVGVRAADVRRRARRRPAARRSVRPRVAAGRSRGCQLSALAGGGETGLGLGATSASRRPRRCRRTPRRQYRNRCGTSVAAALTCRE